MFASDALSSTAYATQEILLILAMAGTGAFGYAFPIALASSALMAMVTISYEQTIYAYPDGGGAYIVARDNLGDFAAELAGSALLIDYILTVAVSVSSGVAQVASAFPEFSPYRIYLAVGLVLFVMLVNLRGVKEAGAAFAIPTYFFLAMMISMVGWGSAIRGGQPRFRPDPPPLEVVQMASAVTPFLLLHAFSSGTTALTGSRLSPMAFPPLRNPAAATPASR